MTKMSIVVVIEGRIGSVRGLDPESKLMQEDMKPITSCAGVACRACSPGQRPCSSAADQQGSRAARESRVKARRQQQLMGEAGAIDCVA